MIQYASIGGGGCMFLWWKDLQNWMIWMIYSLFFCIQTGWLGQNQPKSTRFLSANSTAERPILDERADVWRGTEHGAPVALRYRTDEAVQLRTGNRPPKMSSVATWLLLSPRSDFLGGCSGYVHSPGD